ncbi:MAG: MFS transporter, partial [Deltaproteobacteria bacterium]
MSTRLTSRWVVLYYALTGIPFGLMYDAIPVYLRLTGETVVTVGLFYFIQLAWALKIFWSPLVARFGSPRHWVLGCQLVLFVGLGCLSIRAGHSHIPHVPLPWILIGMALAAATQDIAVDGVFVSSVERGDEARKNGLRVGTYRVAMATGGAGITYVAGLLGYATVFALAAFATLCLCVVVWSQAEAQTASKQTQTLTEVVRSVADWMRRPSSIATLLFILTFKLGDGCVEAMSHVFWVDRGMTGRSIGLFNLSVALPLSICGALLGGAYTSRQGLRRALFLCGLLQALGALG